MFIVFIAYILDVTKHYKYLQSMLLLAENAAKFWWSIVVHSKPIGE